MEHKHRSVHSTKFVRAEGENSRTYQFIISTETRDRHGTIIKMDGWDLRNFNANPIVAYMHQTDKDWWSGQSADPDHILGPGRAFIEDGKLIGEVTFEDAETNPLADKIMRKINYGTLKSTSVGFRHLEGHWGERSNGEDPDTYYYDKVELLEFSIVNIPSNPDALMRSYEDELLKNLPPKPGDVSENDAKRTLVSRKNEARRNQLLFNQNF